MKRPSCRVCGRECGKTAWVCFRPVSYIDLDGRISRGEGPDWRTLTCDSCHEAETR